MSKQTLEQRLVDALNTNKSSAQLGELIAETTSALEYADATAERERLRALDPTQTPDSDKARHAMETSAFAAARLRTMLPRIQARYSSVLAAEEYKVWVEQYERVKAQEVALAEELNQVYPEIAAQLINLLERIEQQNATARACTASKPVAAQGDGRNLDGALGNSIAAALRLPDYDNPRFCAWPVPSTPIAVAAAAVTPASYPRLHSAEWWQVQEEDRRIVAAAKQRAVAAAAAEREGQFHGVRWWKGETA